MDILVKELDESKFQMFVHRIEQMANTVAGDGVCGLPQIVTNRQHSSLMKNIKKVKFLSESDQIISELGDNPASDEYAHRAGQLGTALNGILKCQAMISHEHIMLDRMEESVANLPVKQTYSTIFKLFFAFATSAINVFLGFKNSFLIIIFSSDVISLDDKLDNIIFCINALTNIALLNGSLEIASNIRAIIL